MLLGAVLFQNALDVDTFTKIREGGDEYVFDNGLVVIETGVSETAAVILLI